MLEANFGKEEYLSVKWVFRKIYQHVLLVLTGA